MLYTVSQLLEVTGGTGHNLGDCQGVSSVVIDSRDVPKDALFVAIVGDRLDGHKFAESAIKNGAAIALLSHAKQAELSNLPAIAVDDPLGAMRDLAHFARARSNAKIVGVTGSVGKTSTKEAIRIVCEAFGSVHASIKSYNNHWGVPLMVANLPESADFGIFEMGMNHSGEIAHLTRIVRPHIALITAIGPAHIGELGSMEAIVAAKAEIFEGVEPNGTAILNMDHEFGSQLQAAAQDAHAAQIVTYGLSASDIVLGDLHMESEHSSGHFAHCGNEYEIDVSAAGRHMLVNGLGAVLVAHELGLPMDQSLKALSAFSAPAGRGETLVLGGGDEKLTVVDESYNANPASMAAALRSFTATVSGEQQSQVGRRILVLGDMKELGDMSRQLHLDLRDQIRETHADEVLLVGAEIAVLQDVLTGAAAKISHFTTVEEAQDKALETIAYGDIVMLKGSLSIGLGKLVSAIRTKFS